MGAPKFPWTVELEDEIAYGLISHSLRDLCALHAEYPHRDTIRLHEVDNPAFREKCVVARQCRSLDLLDETEEIVRNCTEENYHSSQVKIGYGQWRSDRMLSKHGIASKQQVEVSGELGLGLAARLEAAKKRCERKS